MEKREIILSKMKNSKRNLSAVTFLTIGLILLDQTSKFIVMNFLSAPIKLVNDYLVIEKSLNPGIAFGIKLNQFILVALTILLIIAIFRVVKTEINLKKTIAKIAASLVLGGAISNLIDRLVLGQVVDFISIKYWPTFNLADVFIVIGVILTILFYKRLSGTKN